MITKSTFSLGAIGTVVLLTSVGCPELEVRIPRSPPPSGALCGDEATFNANQISEEYESNGCSGCHSEVLGDDVNFGFYANDTDWFGAVNVRMETALNLEQSPIYDHFNRDPAVDPLHPVNEVAKAKLESWCGGDAFVPDPVVDGGPGNADAGPGIVVDAGPIVDAGPVDTHSCDNDANFAPIEAKLVSCATCHNASPNNGNGNWGRLDPATNVQASWLEIARPRVDGIYPLSSTRLYESFSGDIILPAPTTHALDQDMIDALELWCVAD